MATIIPLQATVAFEQKQAKCGNYYPCYILSNDRFVENFEKAIIIAKTAIDPESQEFETLENILSGLSQYRVWKYDQTKSQNLDIPEEINEHFGLLPDIQSNIVFAFKPLNNIPSEVMLYTYDEIKHITLALKSACDALADGDERLYPVQGIYESFNSFLTDWDANKEVTGSYFANQNG